MALGRIQVAHHDGAYSLRFEGDVRLTLSASIDGYFEKMCDDPNFYSVWLDLGNAEGLDSTTLGLLAKLAIKIREKFGFSPALYTSRPGITRLLRSMGFHKLFDLREEACTNSDKVFDIPMVRSDEKKMRAKVLEAHRILMGLSDTNKEQFADLVTTLEEAV